MTQAVLRIQFQAFWLAGTGAARGRDLDVVCYRDEDGFPAMPMSQIKGQLRETAQRLAMIGAGGWTNDLVTQVFGYRSRRIGDAIDKKHQQGAVAFRGDARLDEESRRAMLKPEDRGILFRRIAATKINAHGVAEDQTLRAIESAVPLELSAVIEATDASQNWLGLLDAAAAATLAFGKLKSDGYGAATAFVEARQ